MILLWARAAGRCCFPDCKILLSEGTELVGHAAHVIAHRPAGPRGTQGPRFLVDSYDNLILLCAHHHMIVDRHASAYPAETLKAWKAEHESWVRHLTEPRAMPLRWSVIVLEDLPRIDLGDAGLALGPGNAAGLVHRVSDWAALDAFIERTRGEERRFAVFCLAAIALSVQLGFVLGDRGRVRMFHYHRDSGNWAWPDDIGDAGGIRLECRGKGPVACLRVSLSAEAPAAAVREMGPALDIHISVERPSVRWLKRVEQLTALGVVFGQALEEIQARGCRRVHLFYAGPACGAVLFGRLYNPNMNPPLEVYHYRRGKYEPAAVLGE